MNSYGERLKLAMQYRGNQLNRKIGRAELAKVADCTTQNIGMILNNATGKDQKLSSLSHSAVATFLQVSSEWLLHGTGTMELPRPGNTPPDLTEAAIEMGRLYDLIPVADRIKRAMAYSMATTAITNVLLSGPSTGHANPG